MSQWERECCSNVAMVSHLPTYQSGRVYVNTFAFPLGLTYVPFCFPLVCRSAISAVDSYLCPFLPEKLQGLGWLNGTCNPSSIWPINIVHPAPLGVSSWLEIPKTPDYVDIQKASWPDAWTLWPSAALSGKTAAHRCLFNPSPRVSPTIMRLWSNSFGQCPQIMSVGGRRKRPLLSSSVLSLSISLSIFVSSFGKMTPTHEAATFFSCVE